MKRFLAIATLFASASMTMFGQAADTPFQIRYASNLAFGESVINITNGGASSTGTGFPVQNGNICANVYAYSPDEQLVSCCSCNVTPNALVSLSVKADLGTNTLTPIIPSALVIKLLASTGPAGVCDASSPTTVGTGTNVLVTGMAAWGTTIHPLPVTVGTPATTYALTETAFTPMTLSAAELNRMTSLCAFIRANGSGYGICKSCKVGGLGGSVK